MGYKPGERVFVLIDNKVRKGKIVKVCLPWEYVPYKDYYYIEWSHGDSIIHRTCIARKTVKGRKRLTKILIEQIKRLIAYEEKHLKTLKNRLQGYETYVKN